MAELKKKPLAAVTICALNYFPKALVTRASFLSLHPGSDFYIVVVDRRNDQVLAGFSDVKLIWAEDLGIENFNSYAFRYDIIELNTNVKPTVLARLLLSFEKVLYFDPDIAIYEMLQPIIDSLDRGSIVVTPHSLSPILDGKSPADTEFLRFGIFNLGFIGVRDCEEGLAFLSWWSSRCLSHGFYDPQMGLAVDQLWVDLAPCYFPGLVILREPGMNMAFWNLHERALSVGEDGRRFVNGSHPLYFFHFSSFMVDSPHAIAAKQSRFAPESRPDLHQLLDEYAEKVRANDIQALSKIPYTYNYYENGEVVSAAMRRFYSARLALVDLTENPFATTSETYAWAKGHRLLGRPGSGAARLTFKDMGKFSGPIKVINAALALFLRFFGPERYFNLMRYLGHISSIRNQEKVLR